MTIKDGYNNKPTEIRINARENGVIELWIKQEGFKDDEPSHETLSYMTLNELFALKKEAAEAGKDLFS